MKDLRIGLIAQPHNTGIGNQSWEFARHMAPAKVLLTDLTILHGQAGKKVKAYPERFSEHDTRTCQGVPSPQDIDWLTTDVDLVFVIETPLNHDLFSLAKQKGVVSVLQLNWEFLDLAQHSKLPRPDVLLAPSKWCYPQIFRLAHRGGMRIEYLPVPVATDRFEPRLIREVSQAVHVAGHKTYMDRNGTEIVRQTGLHLQSSVQIKIHEQTEQEVENYWELYREGDVLLLPRRYGGLCLQIQEACAAGMIPIIGNHDPYAPDMEVTAKSEKGKKLRLRVPIQTHDVAPEELARKIDQLTERDPAALSYAMKQFADSISWDTLKMKYQILLEELASTSRLSA